MIHGRFRFGESWNERLWFFKRRLMEAAVARQAGNAASSQRSMECPKCQSLMAAVGYQGLDVDICSRCGGVFFDGGELELLPRNDEEELLPQLPRRHG